MKTSKFVVLFATALLSVAGSSAFANDKWLGDRGDNWEEHITSTKTRAQVIAEMNEARAQGLLSTQIETDYPKQPALKSTRTREQVRAEAVEATKNPVRSIDYSSGQ